MDIELKVKNKINIELEMSQVPRIGERMILHYEDMKGLYVVTDVIYHISESKSYAGNTSIVYYAEVIIDVP